MNQGEALRIENLHFRYPGDSEDLIEGLNMQLGRGEILCIAGASGQGKSMLLRLIAGLEMPSDGAIYYFGEYLPASLHSALEVAERGVELIFQNAALISNLNVRDNISMPLYYHHRGTDEEIEARVNMALDLMRVRSVQDRFPHMLSSGVAKRVAIARAWAMDPRLLLMDEPTSGLDNYNRNTLIPLIDNMQAMFKTSLILVTHDLLISKELNADLCFLENKKLSKRCKFDEWLRSDLPIAQEMFRNLRDFL
ncbi:phospholipid/cholesterol/gamma-HCH transport system ATP-binding protein [Fibrobacter intestinalis]|uniref:Phospholipid/cholesterol/gamma-HCH transport system ATP-binding protein n=1 Tax=Fibrobacter intestinalis TaxID=28122 RepID=A0A1M6YQG5_9BACT|nr:MULTISPECIES: ATP-binding cassette domain-containing protein [Fibrobacter]MDD7298597.1 ATP-binding cassette domain-containing protein [Fibrobacter intestinalis]PBC66772.1 phospholipid/cholesterol/gamma-HCH transport system ATP-binding protein [Fibrobacter sp. UWS1]SHL20333.1 phospholipid/cholesterol/gamma-HCH transport system ATP-binding protein [Fibrobacter intestinalis]